MNRFFFLRLDFQVLAHPKEEKKKVLTFPLRGEREERSEGEMKKDKKRKEKGGKCRRSADQRPLKSKKKNNK